MMVHIARGMADLGAGVDFVVGRATSPYVTDLGDTVRVVELGDLGNAKAPSIVAAYLDREQPISVMSAKFSDNRLALAARARSSIAAKILVRVGSTVSGRHAARGLGDLRRWLENRRLNRVFREADCAICVSEGVARDLAKITGLPAERLPVLRNPVVTPELAMRAKERAEHPWFQDEGPPVIVTAAGLRRSKNLPLLIGAFARVQAATPCRLLILGEGRQRPRLESLVSRLGLEQSVSMPGFTPNPYPYMSAADLFVLSSDFEGSPNVLVEAMACGTQVVSTDCASGPSEILRAGQFGRLTPIGDEPALAAAIAEALEVPVPDHLLRQAVEPYRLLPACREYARVLGVDVA